MTSAEGAGSGDAVLEQVRQLIGAGRPQDAVRVAHEAQAQSPADARLGAIVAWTHLATGDAASARAWSEWSLGQDPAPAWVLDLRARALLTDAGTPAEAHAAALDAARAAPDDPQVLSTYARACLVSWDRDGAEWAAAALRRVVPDSDAGPLAEALVEMQRGQGIRLAWSRPQLLVAGVVTQGVGFLILGIGWIVLAVRRAPYLRRADALLREALGRRPASDRSLASDVLGWRFRYAPAVDRDVTAAALAAGAVDGRALATAIAVRNATVMLAGGAAWVGIVAGVDALVAADAPIAALGVLLTTALAIGAIPFDRWQTRTLPPGLRRAVRAQWPPAAVAAAATVFLVSVGVTYRPGDANAAAPGYLLAALVSAPLALIATLVLAVPVWSARRRSL